jgi:hypothetical protein
MTMPRNKDLKRLVRARMKKTGEAYTAARANVLRKPARRTAPVAKARAAVRAAPVPVAELAGMTDAAVKAKTGCTWERWVKALDYHGAKEMSHRDIAALVRAKYRVGPWWSQMVTVGYERIRGLRERGQRRDGTFEASKSRTFDVPVSELFDAWANDDVRRRWLDEPGVRRTAATANRSVRLRWADGGIVAVGFTPKSATRSAVAVQHAKLPDRETATRLKRYWGERLDALGASLRGAENRDGKRER